MARRLLRWLQKPFIPLGSVAGPGDLGPAGLPRGEHPRCRHPKPQHLKFANDKDSNMSNWTLICAVEDIPLLGSRVVERKSGNIALFRSTGDEVFALHDKCPHKAGPLSQGIVHGRTVTCPLHSWKIQFEDGQAVAPDKGCTKHFPCKVEEGQVFLQI